MFNCDFVWLNFDNEFIWPNEEATRTFTIDQEPVAASHGGSSVSSEGFIMIHVLNAGNASVYEGDVTSHRLLINGRPLPSFDDVARDGWNVWMDRIPPSYLHKGANNLTIRRRATDPFRVVNVVVQWREERVIANGTFHDLSCLNVAANA